MATKNKFVGLIILDGYGLRRQKKGNAIKLANPQNINNYFNNYPFTTLHASGKWVGLPAGQIGNSEVGHLNIGAGVVVLQSLQKINNEIKLGSFYQNEQLLGAINHAKQNNSVLHLFGLTSSGGVHSHIKHLYALIKMAQKNGVQKLVVHAVTDGRDTLRDISLKEVVLLEKFLKQKTNYHLATVSGRFYAMDREKDYSRTLLAYNAIVNGEAKNTYNSAKLGIEQSHKNGIYDEFIDPFTINTSASYNTNINSNDSVIFFNFREDRARQMMWALTDEDFKHFKTAELNNVLVTTFTRYDEKNKSVAVAFEKDYVKQNLSSVVSEAGMKQFKITETTKYAHVTYFLNGGKEEPYKNEERFLIETIKTDNFDEYPQMRAVEITDKAIEEIKSKKFNLMVLNYSNCDMIGHTGNLQAAIKAVKVIDEQVHRLVKQILRSGGVAVVCADHGNAEHMIDSKGRTLTDHTTNKVPFCVISNNTNNIALQKNGSLSNIAPTVLELLGIDVPKNFLDSLIK